MNPATAKQLHDAIEACDELQTYTCDWTRDEFLYTRSLQLIVWKLVEIVEDAMRRAEATQPSLRYQIPEWGEAVTTMDRSTLGYGSIDFERLWEFATGKTPSLRQKLADAKRGAWPMSA